MRVLFLLCLFFVLGVYSLPCENNTDDLRTVAPLMYQGTFQADNMPIRTLRVVVFADMSVKEKEVRFAFDGASSLLREQVGVDLVITKWFARKISGKDSKKAITPLLEYQETNNDFDIAVVMTKVASPEVMECLDGVCIVGNSFCRRYIHMRVDAPIILAHEVGHILLWGRPHSYAGLMFWKPESPFFTINDRNRILRDKFVDLTHVRMKDRACILQ